MARLPQLQSFAPQNALIGYQKGAKVAEDQQNRNALLAAGDAAARGDYAGAASAAFKGGNLNAGVAFKGLGAEEAKKELDTVARLAFAADTPEKWAQFQKAVGAKYGPERAAGLGGFNNREAVIAEAQTLDSMISQRFKTQDLAERRADRRERLGMERERLDIARQNANTTTTQKDYQAAVAQGFEGTIFDYQKALNEAKAQGKPLTVDQAKSAGFADRTIASDKILSDPTIVGAATSVKQAAASSVPVVSNFLISEDRQKFEQAQRDFVNAILRRESGAVISDAEFDNAAKQYFPQPGDTPDVIAQKARNRQTAIQGLVRSSGSPVEAQQPATPATPKRLKFNPETLQFE